jgi:hypothetical protein
MPLPIIFANLPEGDNPASLLDDQFNALAGFVFIPCQATGQNVIDLQPFADAPLVSAYTDLAPVFTFVAQQTSSGNVTLNVAGLGEFPAFANNGAGLSQAGTLVAGGIYQAAFVSSLNGGAGGFVINAGVGGTPIPPSPPTPGVEMVTLFVYYNNSTFVPPVGMTSCIVEGVGGGGGGGGALADGVNGLGGGGGGAGGYFKVQLTPAQVGTGQAVTVATAAASETAGGSTSFGSLATAGGGAPGLRNDNSTYGNGGFGGGVTFGTGVTGLEIGGGAGTQGNTYLPASAANPVVFGGTGGAMIGGGGLAAPTLAGTSLPGYNGDFGGGGGGASSNAATGGAIIAGGSGGTGWLVVQAFS